MTSTNIPLTKTSHMITLKSVKQEYMLHVFFKQAWQKHIAKYIDVLIYYRKEMKISKLQSNLPVFLFVHKN